MLTTSNVLLELPKRTAILVQDPHARVRSKARGLFWLTLATVVLALIVVLASLWKTCSTRSVPAAASSVVVTVPALPTPREVPPVPPVPAIVPQPVEVAADPAPEPELAPPVPPGFPSLNQFP